MDMGIPIASDSILMLRAQTGIMRGELTVLYSTESHNSIIGLEAPDPSHLGPQRLY